MNYILVNGFTATGSSAVIDLLKECRNTYIPEHEFRLICDPFGIIDLDREINNSVDSLNDDIAIRCFRWLVRKYCKKGTGLRSLGLGYELDFTKNIYDATENFISNITNAEYSGYWWYLMMNKPFILQLFYKVLRRLKIYDYRKHCKMSLVTVNEEDFLKYTKKYIDDIFSPLVSKNSFIVLDQAIPANFPGYGKRYFTSSKVINVERDARDVYMGLITEEKRTGAIVGHVGLDISKTHNVQLFIDWFKKYRRAGLDGDCLNINFEDLILNYEETKDKIFKYVNFSDADHIFKTKYLKVEKSSRNIGLWKNYEYQDEIRQIELALPQYIYGAKK